MPQADSQSSSGQEQQQTVKMAPYPYPYPQQLEDDNFDLYELLITLWNSKWLVTAVTVVAALGSIVYALQLQQIYKAEALLFPPKAKDIQSLNFFREQVEIIGEKFTGTSAENVFNKFKQNLKSRTLHKKFIQEKGLMEILAPDRNAETNVENIYQGFADMIKLGKKGGAISLSIEMHDGEIAAQWVNDFIEFIDKETVNVLIDEFKISITNQIKGVEYKIASKRQMAKRRRVDQIIRYNEAAIIADSLGIKRRVDATNIIQTVQPGTQMNVDIATASTPLYYLGSEALNTEISVLRNRQSDDPFIGGLRDLQERLTLLNSFKFDIEKMSVVYIDQAAYPPKYAISPNRRLIVSLATVVGLFSGIFLVFLIEFVQNQRKKHSD